MTTTTRDVRLVSAGWCYFWGRSLSGGNKWTGCNYRPAEERRAMQNNQQLASPFGVIIGRELELNFVAPNLLLATICVGS